MIIMELMLLVAVLIAVIILLFIILRKPDGLKEESLAELIKDAVDKQNNLIRQDISSTIQGISGANMQAFTQLSQVLQDNQKSAIDTQKIQIEALQSQFLNFRDNLNAQVNEFQKNILAQIAQMEKNMGDKQDLLKTGVGTQNKELRESVLGQTSQLQDSINKQMEQFRTTTAARIVELENSNSEQQNQLREGIKAQSSQIQASLNEQMHQFRNEVTGQIEKLEKVNIDQQTQLRESVSAQNGQMQKSVNDQMSQIRQSTIAQIEKLEQSNNQQQKQLRESLNSQLEQFRKQLSEQAVSMETRLEKLEVSNEKRLQNMGQTLSDNMRTMREDNSKQLEQIRGTVDEKLQTTLEKRITESFKTVSTQLEQVYKGLGEMQSLANDVGGLKKIMSGVKTRGNLGEYQLAGILAEILAPEQYDTNVAIVPKSSERVEFAVKLPHEDGTVYLPIDSKFPAETYMQLRDAQESGDRKAVEAAYKNLETVIKSEAKDIRTKYVAVPYTTNFAIMFLPAEGLYAEVVSRGMVETLQRDYQVNVAGPSTMAAILNSLQMGFKTLAIQQKSNYAWEVLGAVKTEFEKFGEGLKKMQSHLDMTSKDLDALITTRSNQMQRKLREVERLDDLKAAQLLELADKNINRK